MATNQIVTGSRPGSARAAILGGMARLMLLTSLLVPVLFWAGYHVYHDRHQGEPVTNLVIAYTAGLGAGVLGQQLYRLVGFFGLRYDAYELAATDPVTLLVYAVLGIGVLEELAKLLPFMLIALRSPNRRTAW